MRARSLSIVLPCFNEAEAIPIVLSELLEFIPNLQSKHELHQCEVIVVDDGSTDRSREELQRFKPAVIVLENKKRLGYGAALQSGVAAATGEIIAFFDLDRTYDLEGLETLVEKVLEGDFLMVNGNRLQALQHMPFTRRLGNFYFQYLIRAVFQRQVQDCCSGQRVFKRELGQALFAELPLGLDFSLALTLACLDHNLPFAELAVPYRRRLGRSKLSVVKDGIRFSALILRTGVRHWQKKLSPMKSPRFEDL